MPRPRNTVPNVNVHLAMPMDLMARVYAVLYSNLEQRLPHAAQRRFFIRAAEDLLAKIEMERSQHGQ